MHHVRSKGRSHGDDLWSLLSDPFLKHSLNPPETRKLKVCRSHAMVNLGSGFVIRCKHSMATKLKLPAEENARKDINDGSA